MMLLGGAWAAALAAWAVAAAALLEGARGEPACEAASGLEARIAASMTRNATGHLLVSVDMEQKLRGSNLGEPPTPWHIEALPTVRRCGGTVTHAMRINFVGSPTKYQIHQLNTDYEYIPGAGYYRVHKGPETWIGGNHVCEKENASLLVLNSHEEAAKIKELIRKYPSLKNTWIYSGFYDAGKQNWRTIRGETLKSAGYEQWRTGEKHGTEEIFGCISHNVELGSCLIGSAPFICELNM